MQPFRLASGLSDNPVMGPDHRIGDRRLLFHGAGSKNRPAPIRADVPQAIGKVALVLPTQAGDTVRRDSGEKLRIEGKATQITGTTNREGFIPADLTQRLHMLLVGLPPGSIGEKRIGRDTKLSPDERQDLVRDHLARSQRPPWISQRAKLQGEPQPVLRPAAFLDVSEIVVAQLVMPKQ